MYIRIKKNLVIFLFGVFLLCQNTVAHAAETTSLVNCGRDGQDVCTICHLVEGIHGIVQYIIGFMVIVAITVITIAGIMYVISSGGGMVDLAKKAILNTLIGITVVLVAFMSITYIFNTLFNNVESDAPVYDVGLTSYGNFWEFSCDKTPSFKSDGASTGNTSITPSEKLTCSANDCAAVNNAVQGNASGVDPNVLKAVLVGGEGCNKNLSSDGKGSCGYSQALPKIRTWCGITGTDAETCTKIQNDVNLDVNCAAKLIKSGNSKCSATDVNVVASCYNAGQPNKCSVTTNNYCTRVLNYYDNCINK